ncbi:MAG: hypothetical protein J6S85_00475 [Methanobrevibacter sp.]|nr:hypothetical protein [Methanobrevibacter sp.]MBO7712006.1 hypothetical protein [Methanobrevibacter sp.]
MNVEEREKKNATANPMNKVTNKILKETKSELKELKHTISDNNIRSLQQKRKA